MSGHSQFKNIMYRKGAQDKKRAKIFSKLLKEITVAAKEAGTDPEHNPRLRTAIIAARGENMPKDNIDRALKKIEGGDDGTTFESVRYEGYGPSGIAVIVDALTDNKNRSAAEIRSIFGKNGGALGDMNSVAFMFDRVGCVKYHANVCSPDRIMDIAIEVGATNVESDEIEHEIICQIGDFKSVRDNLLKILGEPKFADIIWKPQNLTEITDLERAQSIIKFIDLLEDNDAVQTVTSNFSFSSDIINKLNEEG